MGTTVTAQFLYHGLPDYWRGDGNRWDDNKACIFASYGRKTTLRELVDALVDDYRNGGDTDGKKAFEDIAAVDVRIAILKSLSDQGRADYINLAVCAFAIEYAACNPDTTDEDDNYDSPQVIFLLTVEVE